MTNEPSIPGLVQIGADPERSTAALSRVGDANADLVIFPTGHDEHGRGLYAGDTLFLAKELRGAGVRATYLDPPGQRLFEVRNSAVVVALASFGLGLLTNAAWDGITWLVHRARQRDQTGPLELQIVDSRQGLPHTTWTLRGSAQDVMGAVERLQATAIGSPGDLRDGDALGIGSASTADFREAGNSDYLMAEHTQSEIDSRLAAAADLLDAARMATPGATEGRAHAEAEARAALTHLASALNWAEDSDREAEAHEVMDGAGRWVRETFGCHLAREGNEYFQRCPVSLAHTRVGMSVGGYGLKVCSICAQDLSECPHVRASSIWFPEGAPTSDGAGSVSSRNAITCPTRSTRSDWSPG